MNPAIQSPSHFYDSTDDKFVEQAEYLDRPDFERWSEQHPDERAILLKLKGGGAKLLTGPRGCGKTTLMLKAYYGLLSSSSEGAFPVYVNFKASLKLEPLYRRHSNAVFLFTKWLLLKVYDGIYRSLETLQPVPTIQLGYSHQNVKSALHALEVGVFSESEQRQVTHETLEQDVACLMESLGKSRCVLLLDDAAHAFSPEQQRDFFEFFRRVKSRTIAPKAAIYPGVTIYSPSFHVGHDAEAIDAWIHPDSKGYLDFMKGMIKRRLLTSQYDAFSAADGSFSLLCFAAFGMPRALLNMIREVIEQASDQSKPLVGRRVVLAAIQQTYVNTISLYRSLGAKMPMYQNFVEAGLQVFQRVLNSIKGYNASKNEFEQSVAIAIKQSLPAELSKVLSFFQYSGLVLPNGPRSRGSQGVFEEFSIHYAALIERNVLFAQRTLNIGDYVTAFSSRDAHAITRTTPPGLLANADPKTLFSLALPPCDECKTPRASEHARFCQNCGAPLKEASLFESLVIKDISELPLTGLRVGRIKEHSSIKTVHDILVDHDHTQLRMVPNIGPYWAKKIFSYAEEFIA
jgi:energy-coupling factor transporter ATP-binding protein EcfA2